MYFNDNEVTQLLLKEIKERKKGKRKQPSDELCRIYMDLVDRLITSGKFNGYTDDWKNDFKSFANFIFIKYWYKFNPKKIAKNKKINDVKDYLGAHTFFTSMAYNAILQELNRKKKRKQQREELFLSYDRDLKNHIMQNNFDSLNEF